jgi:hypothetical protein
MQRAGLYADVATQLHMSTGAIALSVHRMRHHFGELVTEEMRRLWSTLRLSSLGF